MNKIIFFLTVSISLAAESKWETLEGRYGSGSYQIRKTKLDFDYSSKSYGQGMNCNDIGGTVKITFGPKNKITYISDVDGMDERKPECLTGAIKKKETGTYKVSENSINASMRAMTIEQKFSPDISRQNKKCRQSTEEVQWRAEFKLEPMDCKDKNGKITKAFRLKDLENGGAGYSEGALFIPIK